MFFVRRFILLVPLLILISFLAFLLVRLAPGGPFDTEREPASPEIEKRLRERYHLDEPFLNQYLRYLAGLARGDLGPSLKYRNYTVNDIVRQGLPVTLTLGALAYGFCLAVGLPLGVWGAARQGHWGDRVSNFLALLVVCVPPLVLGPVLVMGFATRWGWFPVAFWLSPGHMVLPVVTLGLYYSGKIARLVREGLLETLRSDHVRTARAKGLGEFAVLTRHALPLALLPVVSFSGPLLADLLTGSFVVENLFQIPGIGTFLVSGSLNRDYTMVVGLVILYAGMLLLLNLVVDALYGWIDPRIRRHA